VDSIFDSNGKKEATRVLSSRIFEAILAAALIRIVIDGLIAHSVLSNSELRAYPE